MARIHAGCPGGYLKMVSMSQETPVHKRRVRYRGKNPRRFEERYKEHDPTKYAGEVEHIIAKGNTPAGTHRPICVDEILRILAPQPGETGLDATLGYGGHAQELLQKLIPTGRLFAVDVDPMELPRSEARLRALGFEQDVLVVRPMNFSAIRSLIYEADGGFDFVLADLGVSSMQIDNPTRGFTFKADGPLDLRLNPKKGKPVSQLLLEFSAEQLETILSEHADEPHARVLAKAIKSSRSTLDTTSKLSALVRGELTKLQPKLSPDEIKKSLQRTFMALRIAANDELNVLDRFMEILPECLKPGGRVAILSFHSGEDRRVKKGFAMGEQMGYYRDVAKTPLRPTPEECRANPRASCAKLRWAVRSDVPIA